MGSWNGTCGLSHMPIQDGDNVLLFPLLKDKYAKNGGAGFTYNHNQYAPISIPLFGAYNDYGGIEKITKNGSFVFGLFQEAHNGVEGPLLTFDAKKVARQESINSNYTGTPKDLEELVDVYLRDPVYAGTGYMLVLEDVYQTVLEEVATRRHGRSGKELRAHYTEQANVFLDGVKEKLHVPLDALYEQQRILREASDQDSEENFKKRMAINEQMSMHHGNYRDAFTHNAFVEYFSDYGKANHLFNKLLLRLLVNAPKEAQEALITDYVDLILFDIVLDVTRKLWTPQAGAGSQGSEMYLHKLIAKSVIVREQKMIDEWFEENIAETEEEIAWGRNSTKESIW